MLEFILWYLAISLIGLLALPVAFRFFPYLTDRGYTLARALGLLLWGFAFWLLASLHILQNDTGGVVIALALLAGLSTWLAGGLRGWREIWTWLKERPRLVIISEILFLVAFAFLAVMRSASPQISGTEKPMELAFINAILRSPSFPPADPWLSGYSISYYYFGYVLVAMMTRLTGVASGAAFNLMLALVFALAASGAYGIVVTLLARWSRQRQARGQSGIFSQGWALLAPLMILVLGNLEGGFEMIHAGGIGWNTSTGTPATQSQFWSWLGILEINEPPSTPLDFVPKRAGGIWWWRASRVVQDYNLTQPTQEAIPGVGLSSYQPPQNHAIEVIDEFPFFSYYLADLHPHVLAVPFVMLAIALALNLFLRGGQESYAGWGVLNWLRSLDFWLSALIFGGLAFFNTWDFPIYIAFYCAVFLLIRSQQLGWNWRDRIVDLLKMGACLGLAGIVLYLPFYLGFQSQAGGLLPSLTFFTRGVHFWIMFGSLLTPLVFWLIWLARQKKAEFHWGEGLWLSLCVVGGLWLLSYLLGILGLNLAGLGAAVQSGGDTSSWLGRQAANFISWGDMFLNLQGSLDPGTAFWGSLSRRVNLPGTWLTLFLMLSLVAGLLLAFGRREKSVTAATAETEPEQTATPSTLAASIVPSDPQAFVVLLALVGIGLTLVPEFVYLRDQFGTRMNTIFKFYYQAWMVWGLAGAFALVVLLRQGSAKIWSLGLVSLLVLCWAAAYPYFGLAERLGKGSNVADWTLDGTAYIQKYDPDEWGAMDYLSQATYGYIAEGVDGSYSPQGGARMATHSGLPNVLGWPGHESQWRGGNKEMGSRQDDISRLYRTRDWNEAQVILKQYNVRYVVVGNLERSLYQEDIKNGLRPLDETKFQQNLKAVYQSGAITIYEYIPVNAVVAKEKR